MSTDGVTVAKATTSEHEQVRELLAALVRIPSVNPPGGELPVAQLLGDVWRDAGFDVEIDEFDTDRANVIGRRRWGPGPTLLLNGHMDVQPPGQGWSVDPFGAEVVGDRLYGQGAEDMKAGLAAMTVAATNYAATNPLRGELVLTAVADEMCGGIKGTKKLVDRQLRADFAVVCEPTGTDLYLAHRGALWLRLEVTGRSAHGGRPWLGRNAINAMVAWLSALQEWAPTTLRRSHHELLPDNTLNIGAIAGGHKINVVADNSTAEVDLRHLPGADVADLAEAVRAIGASVVPDLDISVEITRTVDPMETPADAPIVGICRRAYESVVGSPLALGATAGFQDAHYLANELQIPTVMFGPFAGGASAGDDYPSLSGQPDEWVSLSALTTTMKVYEGMIHGALNA
ncbi:MAG: Acetylornithine deacetylase or succinyl-diaminop imelate desuccinylase [Mycobacterium sp.]|jgi:succinyl-diaminopimelate desuccinylase|nr:Acetylornithine deacetylase or succinyl-diaminop imelate desuccinylase [Mycobacterium sp.]